jgi:hypothetical protein
MWTVQGTKGCPRQEAVGSSCGEGNATCTEDHLPRRSWWGGNTSLLSTVLNSSSMFPPEEFGWFSHTLGGYLVLGITHSSMYFETVSSVGFGFLWFNSLIYNGDRVTAARHTNRWYNICSATEGAPKVQEERWWFVCGAHFDSDWSIVWCLLLPVAFGW